MKNSLANIPGLKPWYNYFITLGYKFKFKNISIGYNTELKKVVLGKNISLGKNVSLRKVLVKDYSYVSENTVIRNCEIGKFCSIGPSVKIGVGKHPVDKFLSNHPLFYSTRKQIGFSVLKESKYNEFEKITIGNDVWISANVIILDGVKIGDGAIIAAGAIVINDVAPYSVVAGVPAKHKKYRFSEQKINEILNDPWWDKDFEEIKKMITK